MTENIVKKILIVDDEEFNVDILDEYLKDAGYETILASNGLEAKSKLEANMPVDAIVLDRMMPIMDGMQFLKEIKSKPIYKNIPVIMQTAAGTPEQIIEGITAGVFYYLTKPYEKITLLTILNSALEQKLAQHRMKDEMLTHKNAIKLMEHGRFIFRTMEEAKYVSFTVANAFTDPDKVLFGLNELTINAVEHGNLGITFEEKRNLISAGHWHDEISARLKSPVYSGRFVTLTFDTFPAYYEIRIKDMGTGFDCQQFMNFDPSRLTDPNGRGIAMSKMYSFDEMQYLGNGNEVVCKIKR